DGPAVDPHNAAARRPYARRKHLEQAGFPDARHAVDVKREWAALLEQLEEAFDFPCASGKGGQRAFRNDVAQLLHHETSGAIVVLVLLHSAWAGHAQSPVQSCGSKLYVPSHA